MEEIYRAIFKEEPDQLFLKAQNKEAFIEVRKELRYDINHMLPTKVRGNIKYICHMNTTGYSIGARGYITALSLAGFNVTVETVTGELPPLDDNINNQVTYYCYGRNIPYDTVIGHLVPDSFEYYKEREKGKRFIGFTLWESSEAPKFWHKWLNIPDELIVASEWNKEVFQKVVKKVNVVHHVINCKKVAPLEIAKGKYMFYFIGEWCKRKGIEELILAFNDVFKQRNDVILYIKTFTFPNIVNKDDAEKIFNKYRSNKVIINSDKVDDDFISSIHERGDAYISFAKGEGVGLGAAEAAKHGNPVIAAGYGGHVDYLANCFLTGYREIPADPCEAYHKGCTKDKCKCYTWYDKSYQQWCEPDEEEMKYLMWYVYSNKIKKEPNLFMEINFSHLAIAKEFQKIL